MPDQAIDYRALDIQRILDQLTKGQREALKLFNNGYYMWGEERKVITSLAELHAANSWIINYFRSDYRPGVIAQVQHYIILPAFRKHVIRIMDLVLSEKKIPYDMGD